MNKLFFILVTVVVAIMFILAVGDRPIWDEAQAQQRGAIPYVGGFDSKTWVKATDWNAEALSNRAKWWRLTIKLGANAADSVQVKVHETYTGDWVTLSFPGETDVGTILELMYYGPEIDSVEVYTGTLAYARLDYWFE